VKLGKSSVTYRIGIFIHEEDESKKSQSLACCIVDFTHVYVDPVTRKSVAMPEVARKPLAEIYRPINEKAKL
jgi:acyl-CoA thioesterase FadM